MNVTQRNATVRRMGAFWLQVLDLGVPTTATQPVRVASVPRRSGFLSMP